MLFGKDVISDITLQQASIPSAATAEAGEDSGGSRRLGAEVERAIMTRTDDRGAETDPYRMISRPVE